MSQTLARSRRATFTSRVLRVLGYEEDELQWNLGRGSALWNASAGPFEPKDFTSI